MQANAPRSQIGIGATPELSLRVSVAALARVLFASPGDSEWMLALERRATRYADDTGDIVEVRSQPFGGAIRIQETEPLRALIGNFHFDGEKSRLEQDFRIFIRPSDWSAVLEFCLEHMTQPEDSILESGPERELEEEFAGTMGIRLQRDQYSCQTIGTVVEEQPAPTEYIHARGYSTIRIYRLFEARITDTSLAAALMQHSQGYSDDDLRELARRDFQDGGAGWKNVVLTLPYHELSTFYFTIPQAARNAPILFHGHRVDETVAAVLDGVTVPKYRRL